MAANSMPAREAGSVSDLLRRAQSQANSQRFIQLVGALEGGQGGVAPAAQFAKLQKNITTAEAKTKAPAGAPRPQAGSVAAKVSTQTPAKVVASVSPSVSSVPANRPPKGETAKASAQIRPANVAKSQFTVETARAVWQHRGRDWAGMIASRF